jgi:predicted TIM-barrel fold metal-dependent hydrolase
MAAIRKFYYDTAQAFNEYTLATFTKVVPNSHVLFGTDYPFAQAGTVAKGLADYGFAAANLRAIERDNALELFPRLRGTGK